MRNAAVIATAATVCAPTLVAQGERPTGNSPAAPRDPRVVLADSLYSVRDARGALEQYLKVLAADSTDFPTLCKTSRTEVDLAESTPKSPRMDSLMIAAQRHAEMAIKLRENDVEGHFALARALGRKALSVGTMDRISYSKVIRAEALVALKADSTHAGALHVLGMWNAEIMRVNGFARMFAKTFLGAQVFGLANWDEAQRLLEEAVRVDPGRIVHRLDLGTIYRDRGMKDKAREQFEIIAKAPLVEPNDDRYKALAAERMKTL